MSHTRVHRRIRRAVGVRSQPQGAQAVHGGSVEGAVVDVGLMMVVRWQTYVRQAAVRGEAVAAGGRGGLHRVMLRRRSPIVAVRILRRHLSGNSCALRRLRVALRVLRGMRHPDGTQRQRGLHLPARGDATAHRRAPLVPSELRPPVLEPHLQKKDDMLLLTVLLSTLSILKDEFLWD